MKILAIRGKNLASLEGEFEIDFTSEPLKTAGIFAITGNTGAGKSTILDALCLALFDDTPRTNRAKESIAIPDVKDKLINQKDSRTILRRGCGEGYAEVDFLSLGGEKYRSRWMVKRARGKADGAMQNSELRLVNLTQGQEESGRKTELLIKIVKLIGLNFDQFTRSVLLAQGDFATFLKARQSEKAELLEKLTGTEVYSRISVTIYEKTKNAEQEYTQLMARIQDIELLTDEQLKQLSTEQLEIYQELEIWKKEVAEIVEKIKWINEEQLLQSNIRQIEEQSLILQQKIKQAMPRYEYVELIEKVQEIRDVFKEWEHTKLLLAENQEAVDKIKGEAEKNDLLLKEVEQSVGECERELNVFHEKVEKIEPQIVQARALDVRLSEMKRNVEESRKELEETAQALDENIQAVQKDQLALMAAQKSVQNCQEWFKQFYQYEAVVPRSELVLTLLEDVSVANQFIESNVKLVDSNRTTLELEHLKLLDLQKEAERLQHLLPVEILAWRARLCEGQPCPVCGSIHHPLTTVPYEQSLQEEELEKARKSIAEQISHLEIQRENRQNEMTRLKTLIENYQRQVQQIYEKLEIFLVGLSDWKELCAKGVLSKKIKEISTQWTTYTNEQNKQHEYINQLQATLEMRQKNTVEYRKRSGIQETKWKKMVTELDVLQHERQLLLGGKTVEVVQQACIEKKKSLENRLNQIVEVRNNTVAKQEAYKAAMIQIRLEINKLTNRSEGLQNNIKMWVEAQMGKIKAEQLQHLLSHDANWMRQEKQFLDGLKEQETTLRATLAERKNNLLRHAELRIRPQSEAESLEALRVELENKNSVIEQKTKRSTEIEIALVNHQKGKERIKAFTKELTEKEVNLTNWKKLNELFGSASGSKFKEIAQGYTLDVLLLYANKHLHELTERYKLQRIPETLALQVVDMDMLGENRAVHSLSGGESFLISLALALGLASLSSNRMNVESLFIDEGFGSLDADTLRIAMDALERLQSQGRKIGVISHITEVTERIATRIQVLKTSNGRSELRVVG